MTPPNDPVKTVFGVGDTQTSDGIEFTLVKVENYVDESDFKMDVPDEGNVFVVLWLDAKNTGSEDGMVNMFYESSSVDGKTLDAELLMFGIEGESLFEDVGVGLTHSGYVCFEVPSGWQKIQFGYEPLGGDKIVFTVTPADIAA